MLYITSKGLRKLARLNEDENLEAWVLYCIRESPGTFSPSISSGVSSEEEPLEGPFAEEIYEELVAQNLEDGSLEDR